MPLILQASISSVPAGTVSFLPSTVRVTFDMSTANLLGRSSQFALRFSPEPRKTDSSGEEQIAVGEKRFTPLPLPLPSRTGTACRRDVLQTRRDTSARTR